MHIVLSSRPPHVARKVMGRVRRSIASVLAFAMMWMGAFGLGPLPVTPAAAATVVTFADANLEAVVRQTLAKPAGDITDADMAGLTSLRAGSKGIKSLSGLEHAIHLSYLDVYSNQITDVGPLANLTELRFLGLSVNQVEDTVPLGNLTRLTDLYMSSNLVTNTAPFGKLTELTTLVLNSNRITATAPLRDLRKLKTLVLFSNQVTDTAPLAGLTELSVLGISSNQITDTVPLGGLTNLTSLNISANQVTNTVPLSNLTRLTDLQMRSNQVTNTVPLGSLTGLTTLVMDSNKTTDTAPLRHLTKLKTLILDSNQITDVAPLAALTELSMLSLSKNQIADSVPLGGLTNLTSLYLSFNRARDTEPLGNLNRLTSLDLAGNEITNTVPLGDLANLTTLDLSGNKIANTVPLGRLTQLTLVNLGFNQITDTAPLGGLPKLGQLWLAGNRISDISPLAGNAGLGAGDKISLDYNYLDLSLGSAPSLDLAALVARGVAVTFAGQRNLPQSKVVLSPPTPDGADGWYKSIPSVSISGTQTGGFYSQWDSPGGAWKTYHSSFPAPEGVHTLYYYAANYDGMVESANSFEVKVDRDAPVLDIASPAPGTMQVGPDITVTGSASDVGASGLAKVEVALGSGVWQTASGTADWSITLPIPESAPELLAVKARATDVAGNSVVTQVDVATDKTPPATSIILEGKLGGGGWYVSGVDVMFSGSDGADGSGVRSMEYSIDGTPFQPYLPFHRFMIGDDGVTSVRYRSTDHAGNVENPPKETFVRIDRSGPGVMGRPTTAANSAGWYKDDVVMHFTAYDLLSGVATLSPDVTITGEGRYLSASAMATDVAGNTGGFIYSGIRIDRTPPSTLAQVSGLANEAGWHRSGVSVALLGADALSGVARTEYSFDGENWTPGSAVSIADDGDHTLHYRSVDLAGNVEGEQTVDVRVDSTPPAISGVADRAPDASGWYNHDVTIGFTAGADLSGVVSLTPPVTLSAEGVDQAVVGTVTDAAGNSASVTVGGISIDRTAPAITLSAPAAGAVYPMRAPVVAAWSVVDELSGVAAQSGTTADGVPIDTSSAGPKTYSVVATDAAGNRAEKTVEYSVARDAAVIAIEPVNSDGTSIFKAGSTVPLKFQLKNAAGDPSTSATAKLYLSKLSDGVWGTEMEALPTNQPDSGNTFRVSGGMYMFNLSTKSLQAGTWQLRVLLDDGTSHVAVFSLR